MMAKVILVLLILATATTLANGAREFDDSPAAPAPSSNCETIAYDMIDCIPFLSTDSSTSAPEQSCCTGFESVVSSDPSCICPAIKGSAQMGIILNMTRVVKLPSLCKSSYEVGDCGVSLSTSNSPVPSPMISELESPSLAPPTDQELAPAPSVDCATIAYDMVDCVPYLSENSTETAPIESCCSGFESVAKADPACLCVAIQGSAQLGITLNMTRVSGLPSRCKLTNLPTTDCKATSSPMVPTPAYAPEPETQTTPSQAQDPANGELGAASPAQANGVGHSLTCSPMLVMATLVVGLFSFVLV